MARRIHAHLRNCNFGLQLISRRGEIFRVRLLALLLFLLVLFLLLPRPDVLRREHDLALLRCHRRLSGWHFNSINKGTCTNFEKHLLKLEAYFYELVLL